MMQYDAFISYSHAADEKLAPRLQHALHRVGKPWYKMRRLHVYRDTTNLALNPDLWGTIVQALDSSRFFVLFASPQAAESPWVRKEIEHWLGKRDARNLLIVATDGTIIWNHETNDFDWEHSDALPKAMAGAFDKEPLWLDLSWSKRGQLVSTHDPRFQDGVATIGAALLGLSKDALIGEDVRHRRNTLRTVAAFIGSLCLAITAALWQWNEAVEQAIESRSLANAARARLALTENQPDEAIELALKANQVDKPSQEAVQALADVAYIVAGTRRVLAGHQGAVTDVGVLPGEQLALTSSKDGTIKIWSLDSGKSVRTLVEQKAPVSGFDIRQDGKQVMSTSTDGRVCLWEIDDDSRPSCFAIANDIVHRAVYANDATNMLFTSDRNELIWWNIEEQRPLGYLEGHSRPPLSLSVSPDRRLFASGGEHGRVCLWNADTMSQRCCVELEDRFGPTHGIKDLAFSPDGQFLVAAFGGYPAGTSIALVETQSCSVGHGFRGHEGGNAVVAVSPTGRFVLSGTRDRQLVLWDIQNARALQRLHGHRDAITSVAFGEDERTIISGAADGTSRTWSVNSGAEQKHFAAPAGDWLAVSTDGFHAVTRSEDDRLLRFWAMEDTPRKLQEIRLDKAAITAAINEDAATVLVGDIVGQIHEWTIATNTLRTFTQRHPNRVTRIVIDGTRNLALSSSYIIQGDIDASRDQLLLSWDIERGEIIHRLAGHQSTIRDVAINRQGTRAVSGSAAGGVRLWDLASGEQVKRFEGHDIDAFSVAFSPDGSRVASASRDLSVRIWNTDTGDETGSLLGHTGSVMSVAFSPDGESILSSGADSTVRLWDAESGEQISRFQGHTGEVVYVGFRDGSDSGLSFARDTDVIKDNTMRWWNLTPPDNLVDWVCTNRFVSEFECPAGFVE